jgi:hypothetical protein
MTLTFEMDFSQRDAFRDDPEYASEFYTAIGRIVVAWGRLERSLHLLVYSARKIESDAPILDDSDVGLKRTTKALRAALRG